ncbi:HYR domain-containing protein [Lentimicrobium sp. L6]|uniref:HYR domain-containing protein n=1 Tax=Lentimicrobium sp. L6 TaxID=2735916 RepID=UPI00155617A2|nr:HYR domain-containing protein [Lentimicrobium sp. L6]NPD86980.1 HYR domain-containing protein [Lentimicrobium sp. L6]
MKNLLLFIILILGLFPMDIQAQTSVSDPPGTSVSSTPSSGVYIGKTGGKTFSYTNTNWPDWMETCYTWGLGTTLNDVINGYSLDVNCPVMDDLSYAAGSSNLSGGIIVYTGNTNYRFLNTSSSWVTQSVSVKMTITITDAGGPVTISQSGSLLLFPIESNFNEHVIIEAYGPSNANYIGSSNANQWTPAVELFDNLHTDPSSFICTSFDNGSFYSFSTTAVASNSGPYCPGETITLTSSGGTSYSWTGPDSFSSAVNNPTIPNSTSSNFGTYIVEVTDANAFNCVDTTKTIVNETIDNTAPIAICKNIEVELNAAGNATITASQVDNGSSDACSGIASLSVSPNSFDCNNIGNVTVTLTVTDNASNTATCNSTVTVKDITPPVASCKNATIYLSGSKSSNRNHNQNSRLPAPPASIPIPTSEVNNGSSDECGIANLSVSPATVDCSNLGTNTVTLTVTDNGGNQSTCTSTVTVVDDVPPVITVCALNPANIPANSACQASTPDFTGQVTATDNCTASPSITQSPSIGSTLGLGTTTITLTATDGSGNTATCTVNQTVVDNTAPTITVCASTPIYIIANASCQGTAPNLTGSVTATDNCTASPTITQSPAAGATLGLGTTTITLTATDGSGNTH